MTDDDVPIVLMAIADILGIWDREMRIPEPGRLMLVQLRHHHWKLDGRGFPLPTKELLRAIHQRQRESEQLKRDGLQSS